MLLDALNQCLRLTTITTLQQSSRNWDNGRWWFNNHVRGQLQIYGSDWICEIGFAAFGCITSLMKKYHLSL
jgi:hypothetical protein